MFFNNFIAGPAAPMPYVQPDYRISAPNSKVAGHSVGSNVLAITWPLPVFVEKLSDADDPHHTVRGH
jgi:hypothetical protein